VNVVLIALGILLVGSIARIASGSLRDPKTDLGTVSTQWLAEYRQSQE